MTKLVALSALIGAAVALDGRVTHACEKNHHHESRHCVIRVDNDDDDKDRDDDDEDDDDEDDRGGPGFHIRIVGPLRAQIADEPPEPPEPPPPPPPPRRHARVRTEVAFPEPAPAPALELHERAEPASQPTSIIGVGLRASALHVGHDGDNAASGGVLLRFRTRPVMIELDIGRDEYFGDIARSDTRIGASLMVPLTSTRVQPFLVVGTGMNFSFFNATGDELHQGYLSGGGGLSFNVTPRFALEIDARYMLRQFFDGDRVVARQGFKGDSSASDQAAELRLAGVFYF